MLGILKVCLVLFGLLLVGLLFAYYFIRIKIQSDVENKLESSVYQPNKQNQNQTLLPSSTNGINSSSSSSAKHYEKLHEKPTPTTNDSFADWDVDDDDEGSDADVAPSPKIDPKIGPHQKDALESDSKEVSKRDAFEDWDVDDS